MRRVIWYFKTFGLNGFVLAYYAMVYQKTKMFTFYCSELESKITIRTKTSDLAVFEKVVKNREYELPSNLTPNVIIDAGANNGFSALFFSVKYPNAKVIAIEPEMTNFELLSKNVSNRKQIVPVNGALWSKSERINIGIETDDHSGFRIEECSEDGDVQGFTITDLIEKFKLSKIDVLKVDVEGSEKEIFEHSADWIDIVDLVVIELHDRFKPGCSAAVDAATVGFAKQWEFGENMYYQRTI